MLEMKAVKIHCNVDIGSLNDRKKQVLSSIFSSDEWMESLLPIPGIAYTKEREGLHVLVFPSQLSLGYESSRVEPDFDRLVTVGSQVIDKLMLEDLFIALYEMVSHIIVPHKSPVIDTMKESALMFGQTDLVSHANISVENGWVVKGIGIKHYLETRLGKGIIQVEPFVKTRDRFFIRLELGTREKMTWKDLCDNAAMLYSSFLSIAGSICDQLTERRVEFE